MSDILSYLILFLPLIASVFCFLINFKQSDFLIFIISEIVVLVLIAKLGLGLSHSDVIKSDLRLGILSIPTEYYLDFLSLVFLLMIILAKIAIAFFYRFDIKISLNRDNRQLFYVVSLLNLFGLVGIFLSDNIFNLYIFIEIYCLTFCAIMAMSNDLDLSKLAFKYFCLSVSSSILLLLTFVLLYLSSNSLKISEIANHIEQKNVVINWLLLPISVAILLKFFPLWLYFKKIKSRDSLTGFFLNFAFVINSGIGLYLLIRFLFYLFEANLIFLNLKLDLALMVFGAGLVFYGNYKVFKCQDLTGISAFFAVSNLGFVAVALAFFSLDSNRTILFYIANYLLINLVFFAIANHLRKNFVSCHIKNLELFKDQNWQSSTILYTLIFLLLSTPVSLLFWANWRLIMGVNDDILADVLLVAIITTTSLVLVNLVIKMINFSYFPNHKI